jgi:hypothetical protein
VLHSGMHWWLLKLWFHTSTICEDFTYTKSKENAGAAVITTTTITYKTHILHVKWRNQPAAWGTYTNTLQCLLCRFFHKESHWHPVLWIPLLNIESQWWQVFPVVNSTVLEQLIQVDAVVYGIGSLYTSICPSLVLYAGSLCFITYSWSWKHVS